MQQPPIPDNERARIAALRGLALLDTPREERFDRYTRFARRLFETPVSFVSLIDEERQWFKSVEGMVIEESPRAISLCAHAIMLDVPLVIHDTLEDERFKDNPLVTGPPKLRFYAGVPLRTPDGLKVGTLCVADVAPRQLDDADLQLLIDLAAMLEHEFHAQTMGTTDELTGLSNRRGFRAIAGQALAMCRRLDKPATLMFFDLDGFKRVNDTEGHAEGDRVLQEIGTLMLHEFRNSDVIARLGGDEFCVLLTGTDTEHVAKPLANLEVALNALSRERSYQVGYSVGTVVFDDEHHANIDDLLREADAAMYREKKARKEERD